MTRSLLRKELAQHGLLLLLASMLALGIFGLVFIGSRFREESGSALESLRIFLIATLVPLCLLLGHRLVVVEYQARTQLFLEALPVSRARMVAVKYGLGLALLLATVGAAFATAAVTARILEHASGSLLGFVAIRTLAVTWTAYNVFFAMGFLGRYRVAAFLGLLVLTMAIGELSSINLTKFGPLALLDERFPYEGDRLPAAALRQTLALGAVFLGLTAALGLVREGSVASLLAERMSHREKVFVAVSVIGGIFLLSVLSERRQKKPFDLARAVVERRRGMVLKFESGPPQEEAALQRHAARVADTLEGVKEFLGIDEFPPVFFLRRSDLDPNRFLRAATPDTDGLQLHANPASTDWSGEAFSTWLIREVLIDHSNERAAFERRMWLLDGFGLYWLGLARADAPLAQDRIWALRALYGIEAGFDPANFERWLTVREQLGGDIASGVAWSALRTLARRHGTDRCQGFLRATLALQPPKDFRVMLDEKRLGLESLLREHFGIGRDAFIREWQEEIAEARRTLGTELKALPILRASVTFPQLSPQSRRVTYQLQVENAPTNGLEYQFQHFLLGPFDEPVGPSELRRERHQFPSVSRTDLPESVTPGARLYSTCSARVPALGCEVISGWTRRDVP